MTSSNQRHVVGEVLRFGGLDRRRETPRAKSAQPVNVESRKPAVARNLRDSLNAVLRWHVEHIRIRDEASVVVVVDPYARFIDEGWREQVRLAERQNVKI